MLLATAAFLASNLLAAPQSLVTFQRGDSVWIANADGSNPAKLTKGSASNLSPDGARVAFQLDKSKTIRRIGLVGPSSKRVTFLEVGVPSDFCQHPIWSPDGKSILIEARAGDNWKLAVVNADGTNFHYLRKSSDSLYSSCWAPDGQSIYAQDLTNLYQIGQNGSELKKWSLSSLLPGFSLSSGANISFSPDGRSLLVDAESEVEPVTALNWDGLASSLWQIDLAAGKADRLTPKGILAWHACWLSANKILFTGQSAKENEPSIYVITLRERNSEVILKNAQNPSASVASMN